MGQELCFIWHSTFWKWQQAPTTSKCNLQGCNTPAYIMTESSTRGGCKLFPLIGLYTNFDQTSSLAKVVICQRLAGVGSGMLSKSILQLHWYSSSYKSIVSTTLLAAQAALSELDAVTTGDFWACLPVFRSVWGISVPAAIFNSRFAAQSHRISNAKFRNSLGGSNGYCPDCL